MSRPRKQTYTLDMYLKKNRKGDIDNNADVQRNFVWNNEQINELIVTVLTDDYIPPIILGEEENSRLHIVDGGQRTAALIKYKYGNYKITSSIENSLIPFKKRTVGENGSITYENAVFDIKNITYEQLPEELKEKFDEYQIETVIHGSCDGFKISRYIKRYNNHVAMNTDQKAFTYIDKFASRIREILNGRFFVECNNYSEKDKTKGAVERIVVETMMCMNHFENWKKQAKAACKFLNDNATEEEFEKFADNLHRLEKIITDDTKDIFNKKDSFIFLTLFDKFVKLGVDDKKFAEFLRAFDKNLRPVKRNDKGLLFDEIDKDLSTKDKQVITDKLSMLENMMFEFLDIDHQENNNSANESSDLEAFIAGLTGVDREVLYENIDSYVDMLEGDYGLKINCIRDGSKLLDEQNTRSLLAMVVYAEKTERILDDWLTEYAKNNNTYFVDQKKNYIHMRDDFEQYCRENRKSA